MSCAAKWCSSENNKRNITYKTKYFFRFPCARHRAAVWALKVERSDLLSQRKSLHKTHRLCEDHFEARAFKNKQRTILKTNAIPTLFSLKNRRLSSVEKEHSYFCSSLFPISEDQSELVFSEMKSSTNGNMTGIALSDVNVIIGNSNIDTVNNIVLEDLKMEIDIGEVKVEDISPNDEIEVIQEAVKVKEEDMTSEEETNCLTNFGGNKDVSVKCENTAEEMVEDISREMNGLSNFNENNLVFVESANVAEEELKNISSEEDNDMDFVKIENSYDDLEGKKAVQTTVSTELQSIDSLKSQNSQLLFKIKILEEKFENIREYITVEDFKVLAYKFCDRRTAEMISRRVMNESPVVKLIREPSTENNSIEYANQCLKIYFSCPKTYEKYVLRAPFLPDVNVLFQYVSRINLNTGTENSHFFNFLKTKIDALKLKSRHFNLSLIKVNLIPGLFYNRSTDKVMGLSQDATLGNCCEFATFACVLVLEGLDFDFEQPLAYYLFNDSTYTPFALKKILCDVDQLKKLKNIGINICSLVVDFDPVTESLYRMLGLEKKTPHFNLFKQGIYLIFDLIGPLLLLRDTLILNQRFRTKDNDVIH